MVPTNRHSTGVNRRTVLKVLGTGVVAGSVFSGSAAAAGDSRFETLEGESRDVTGDGEIDLQTTAQVCRNGTPVYLGIWMSEEAFDLITSNEAEGDHQHSEGGVSYNLELPELEGVPYIYAGIDWGPQGHPPAPWQVPHFDLHFYLEEQETIAGIEGGIAEYEIPDERIPEGYVTAEALGAPREVVPGMGEHLLDPTTPELGGEQFTHTLIWGSYDVDGDGLGDSIFTEPMVTSDFMANLDGEVVAPVALPAEVPRSGYYPTEYSIQHSADEGHLVTIQNFVWRDA